MRYPSRARGDRKGETQAGIRIAVEQVEQPADFAIVQALGRLRMNPLRFLLRLLLSAPRMLIRPHPLLASRFAAVPILASNGASTLV